MSLATWTRLQISVGFFLLENYVTIKIKDDTDMRDDQMDTVSSSPTHSSMHQSQNILLQQQIHHQPTQQRTTTPQQINSPTINSPASAVKLLYLNSPVSRSVPGQQTNPVAYCLPNQVYFNETQ